MVQTADLGNAHVPSVIKLKNRAAVKNSYRAAFISAYSKIMRISATLGFLGALMSFIFIRNDAKNYIPKQ